MKKKGVIFFAEGDTEIEFYKKMIEYLHNKKGRFNIDKILFENIKGITNYKNRVNRIFNKRTIIEYPNYEFIVFLCYDTDVFEYEQHPKINWKEIEKDLKKNGAIKIIHVKAKKSIEDWFLKDKNNIIKFLKLSKDTKLKGKNGQEKIKNLFKKANKTYIKGQKCEGLIDNLDMKVILKEVPDELKAIYRILEID